MRVQDKFCSNAGIGAEGDGLAEWLSITYGDQGLKVSALCRMGVRTRMLERAEFDGGTFLLEDAIPPRKWPAR
jgi:hypothetical protein